MSGTPTYMPAPRRDGTVVFDGNRNRRSTQPDLAASDARKVLDLLDWDGLYELGDTLADRVGRDPLAGGRPRAYPLWLVVAIAALNAIYRTNRRAMSELADPDTHLWELMRTTVATKAPHRPELHLPPMPPHRTWYAKTRGRNLAELADIEAIAVAYIDHAVDTARTIGLPAPSTARNRPSRTSLVYADGKVITPATSLPAGATRTIRVVDPATGEIFEEQVPRRHDPDAKTFHIGTGEVVLGNKFAIMSIRNEHPLERVVLGVAPVANDKGSNNSENHIITDLFKVVSSKLPEVQGLVTDGVLAGKDRADIIRSTGKLVINPPTAAKVDKATGTRTEKEGKVQEVTFTYADGTTRTVEIHHRAGRLCALVTTADGHQDLLPLARVANPTRANLDGTYRDYIEVEVPNPRADEPAMRVRVSTITNDADRRSGFNRSELIAQIPQDDDTYRDVYPGRLDTESINSAIDRNLLHGRARSYGSNRQFLDLLGEAIHTTSHALGQHRRRIAREHPTAA